MKFKTYLFALLAWSTSIFAQDFESYEAPIIEVVGKSEIEVLPDEIYLSIRITASDEDREDGYSIDVKEDSLIAGLRKIGISMDQLSLTNANSSTVQINWFRKDLVQDKNYSLMVKDAETASEVLTLLAKIRIPNAYISKVDHSNLIEIEKENRIQAIKAAKEKADYLLSAIDEETGQTLHVVEFSENPNSTYRSNTVRGSRGEGTVYFIDGVKVRGSVSGGPLQFQKIKISSVVEVTFAIKIKKQQLESSKLKP